MIKKWKEIRRDVYKHSSFRSIVDVEYELPNGKKRVFSLKNEDTAVAVLALDSFNNVILAKQYRPGPDHILDELPGGGVHKGELPLEAIKRELKEETGYESNDWRELGIPFECAYSTITRHAFLATSCTKTGQSVLDDTEFIEVVKKPISDFFEQLLKGECTDPEVA